MTGLGDRSDVLSAIAKSVKQVELRQEDDAHKLEYLFQESIKEAVHRRSERHSQTVALAFAAGLFLGILVAKFGWYPH